MPERPTTLGELITAGYGPKTVKDEVRDNLIAKLKKGENVFPGILGYEKTVIPALQNAILARHDIILLGLRGQAKTRILRSLVNLLDEEIPVIVGSELNESPFAPFTAFGRRMAASAGSDLPVAWLPREARYREKLATPDVTIADLIGDVDPVKAATLRKTFADEDVIHYGIVPRTNRGIFAINELPDLQPRIQVGLLNILEERDLQIRGFPLRIPLDILMVFSANPEDYTNRGNIITPLKDRIASQILTHYPADAKTASAITDQESWTDRETHGVTVLLGDEVKLLVEEIAFVARRSELVDQSSGVSARLAIAARELLVSNLERRALKTGESVVAPRLVDFFATLPAITGKVEMVFEGEQQGAEIVAKKLIGDAVKALFEAKFPPVEGPRARAESRRRPRSGELDEDDVSGPTTLERAEARRGTAAAHGGPGPVRRHRRSLHRRQEDHPLRRHAVLRAPEDARIGEGPLGLRPQAREAARPLRAGVPHGARPRGPRPEPPHRARGPRLDGHVRRAREVQPDAQPGVGGAAAYRFTGPRYLSAVCHRLARRRVASRRGSSRRSIFDIFALLHRPARPPAPSVARPDSSLPSRRGLCDRNPFASTQTLTRGIRFRSSRSSPLPLGTQGAAVETDAAINHVHGFVVATAAARSWPHDCILRTPRASVAIRLLVYAVALRGRMARRSGSACNAAPAREPEPGRASGAGISRASASPRRDAFRRHAACCLSEASSRATEEGTRRSTPSGRRDDSLPVAKEQLRRAGVASRAPGKRPPAGSRGGRGPSSRGPRRRP